MSEGTPPPPPPENPYGAGAGQTPPPPPSHDSPGGYGAPAPPPPAAGERPGELLDRFLARLIDLVLLFVVNLVILVPVIIGILGINGSAVYGAGGNYAAGAVSAVLSTIVYLGYYGVMESTRGQTVGKMLMKLHVRGASGGKPSLEEALKRNIWMGLPILGLIPFAGIIASLGQLVAVIMIAVGINNDPVRRQPWTDKFAGTQVLKEG